MPKEILLYSSIDGYSSSEFITAMDAATDNDVCVRINSIGGTPEFGFGMIAKFKEHTGNKLIKVDGKAHSMAAFFLCYSDDVEALEVAEFIVHRAAWPDWFETNPDFFTDSVRENTERINGFLRKALEAKIDVAKFEALKGVTMKQLFSLDGRINVTLTAAEAKKVGLISRIVKITPEKTAEVKSLVAEMTAQYMGVRLAAETEVKPEIIKPNNMTIAELKANHPELFASVVATGISKEKDRVEACLVFLEVDPAGVKAAIESGAELSAKTMAEFSLKAMGSKTLTTLAAESAASVITAEVEKEKTEKEKTTADFLASVDTQLGLGSK